ncbi:MAG: hypothetical protein Q4D62_14090 [Planctomycetia bacterium]|nr:hypothetical protein [Planctomycetia bacterium]
MRRRIFFGLFILGTVFSGILSAAEEKPCFSGIYPHLAYFNQEEECGTGAVVPWAGKLWVVTYGPHSPFGSSDKLYEIDTQLNRTIRPESIGGTHANRMIHRESQQLFIGYHVIDKKGNVRTIPVKDMVGRLTGNARHLTDPANRIYVATMEEGFYDVDVHTLEVKTLYSDPHKKAPDYKDILPGYHGKGFYSSQGRVVYSNNGEQSEAARRYPETVAGCLASWDGKDWTVVLRNQFTEVTGPGGIYGNENPDDLLWSLGWDYRSVILMVLEDGKWTKYRLPKASHCYDGAHGWNTEWPRIREIGEGNDYLMTMHGTFWRFPNDFSPQKARGIRPRSTYLKVIGDFCFWNGKVVAGCDDTAKSEFLNKSPFKGTLAEPGQSNSNLWFIEPSRLDDLGTPFGRGAVWFEEPVRAETYSDPYLFAGYDYRGVHLKHDAEKPVVFTFEVDTKGDGTWTELKKVEVSYALWVEFPASESGEWIRVKANTELPKATCYFQYKNADSRPLENDARFDGLAMPGASDYLGGLLWVRADNQRLAFVSQRVTGNQLAEERYYELTEEAKLVRAKCPYEGGEAGTIRRIQEKVAVKTLPETVYRVDDASVVCGFEGKEYRLPFGCEKVARTQGVLPLRLDREVATERDLFHCAGTFYELPAVNAGGMPKIRPVATDGRWITDYASYRGMMILAGLDVSVLEKTNLPHIIRSEDGHTALWAGCIDDLWKLGKAVGHGATWKKCAVAAQEPSLPFLMTGFDKKSMKLINHGKENVTIATEIDLTGTGVWVPYKSFEVPANGEVSYEFPQAFQAYWIRTVSDRDAELTAEFRYW